MRSIVRRETGESYEEFLRGLAKASGLATPTREQLARRDRKRKKRMSNEWKSPSDEDARIAKMKDGRTHLAHKAEHAVDLDTGAVVAVTLQGADQGDTTTLDITLSEAGMAVAEQIGREAEQRPEDKPKVNVNGIEEVVADKGYHSGAVLERVKSYQVRSYLPEKQQKGRRQWQGKRAEQQAVYQNRRRVQGEYGKSLLRRRGELVERSFAHCYDTGGMRRTHLRGHENILKRQLIHVGAFNLSLILRKLMGAGTPREWKNRGGLLVFSCFFALLGLGRSQSVMQKQNSTTLHETTQRTMNWKTSLAVPEITCLHHRLLAIEGIFMIILVPLPGSDSTKNSPCTKWARSCMLTSPKPFPLASSTSKPAPLSLISS
jgi:transposase